MNSSKNETEARKLDWTTIIPLMILCIMILLGVFGAIYYTPEPST